MPRAWSRRFRDAASRLTSKIGGRIFTANVQIHRVRSLLHQLTELEGALYDLSVEPLIRGGES